MEKIIDKVIEAMKKSDSLTDDEEIVRRGLEIIAIKIFFAVIIIIAGLLTGCFLESILFTAAFTSLRQYSGGYHADSQNKCFLMSTLMLMISLSIIKSVKVWSVLILPLSIIAIISTVYVFAAAPIDTPNKRLDNDEIRVYGKRARIFAAVLAITAAAFYFLDMYSYATAVMTGIVMSAYLMLKGQISNFINREKV